MVKTNILYLTKVESVNLKSDRNSDKTFLVRIESVSEYTVPKTEKRSNVNESQHHIIQ